MASQATFAALAAMAAKAAEPQPAPSPVLPGYRLLRQLAEGGMGTVWLAEHAALQRTVALKVMRPELARDQAFVERFVREARIAARLSHPGVVTVHDAGVAGDHLYLAMEYVPGGDLAMRLAAGRMSEVEAVALITQVAEALQAIHDAGLVHRDLKPENILLDDLGRPKIADLGLARASQGDDRMTQTGQALGTPAYMSPEQANGVVDLDARSDVYSLAATLYAMVTGGPPFTGPSPWATVAKVISEPPPDPRAVNPSLSTSLAAAVMRALAKDRAARPPDARAFVAELTASAVADPFAPPLKRWWRNPWLVGVGSAYLLVGVIGFGATLAVDDPAPAPGAHAVAAVVTTPAPESSRTRTELMAAAGELGGALRNVRPTGELGGALRNVTAAVRGTVLDAIDGRVAVVHRAVIAAFGRNGLTVTADERSAREATVEADFADGDAVRVQLSVLAPHTTQVAVQIGAFGDERRARTLLGWIRDEM